MRLGVAARGTSRRARSWSATSSSTAPRAATHTFYDGPETTHVSAADPYCADLRRRPGRDRPRAGLDVRDGGTVVVIEGPRFSTRAESAWFAAAGWDVINMTAYPEGWLARELGLCYANVSLVTDYDVGVQDDPSAPAGDRGRWSRCSREQRAAAGAAAGGDPAVRAAAGRRVPRALAGARV